MPKTAAVTTAELCDEFLVVHGLLEDYVARFAVAVDALEDGDAAGAARLIRAFDLVDTFIEHHHENEDHLVYPLLVERRPVWKRWSAELEGDHQVLLHDLQASRAALVRLAAGDGSDALAEATEVSTVLRDGFTGHLRREEREMLPVLGDVVTDAESTALAAKFRKGVPPSLAVPAAIELGMATEAEIPLPLRLLNRYRWQPRFAEAMAPLAAVTVAA